MENAKTIPVTGMHCAACAGTVEDVLKNTPGVSSVSVNYANEKAYVQLENEDVDIRLLQKQVQAAGYDLIIDQEIDVDEVKETTYQKTKRNLIWTGVFAVPLFIIGMFFMDMPYANYLMLALATPILFVFGRRFFTSAYSQAKLKRVNMDTLVALSTGIAYLFSLFTTFFPSFFNEKGLAAHVYFEASGTVIFFILIGKLLEEKAKNGTSEAIKKLINLQPKTVIAIRNGEETSIPIKEVMKGDLLLVKPGEKIPVDGKVKQGESYVDESTITGEPIPVLKTKKNEVYAGTLNQKGSLKILASKVGKETYLAQIIEMVEQAQGSKAPVQKKVDKISSIFVPAVLGISLITFLLWMLLGAEHKLALGMLSALSVLVIACPCALGLATPTAIMVGIGKGADAGILIKNAESLETIKDIDVIIFDKTGTVTVGKPEVSHFQLLEKYEEEKSIVKGIEGQSEHPLAEAIMHYLKDTQAVEPETFESITGSGVKGTYHNHTYYIGKPKELKRLGVKSNELNEEIAEQEAAGKTVVVMVKDQNLMGYIAIEDQIKPTAQKAIKELKDKGIKVIMLSGDNEATVARVAKTVGIDTFKGNCLPSDKSAYIKKLQDEGKLVAMVGDGINDSVSLATADVGVAMGSGADIAIDVAKMAILSSDLLKLPEAIELSQKTVRAINQNLFWAFIYNLIGIPLAAGLLYPINGLMINPMIAGAAMAFSSVSVVLNSLRLKLTT